MRRSAKVAVVAVLGLVGCGPAVDDGTTTGGDVSQSQDMAKAVVANGKGIGTLLNNSGTSTKDKTAYHGGAVVTGTPDVYFIWYGDWSANTAAQTILSDFASTLGSTSYMVANQRYTNAAGQAPSGALIYGGDTTDLYSHGSSLSDADLAAVVAAQISSGALPQDPSGIYVVLGSADVTASSGFCSAYCGQHQVASYNGAPLRWIFVGNADRCPSACSPQSVSPNGNAGADAMASTLAGEISDTLTDPTLTAWYDRAGLESGDKCAWSYGTTYATANGAQANIKLGQRDFLLQRLFWPTSKGGVCVMNQTQALAAIAAGADVLP